MRVAKRGPVFLLRNVRFRLNPITQGVVITKLARTRSANKEDTEPTSSLCQRTGVSGKQTITSESCIIARLLRSSMDACSIPRTLPRPGSILKDNNISSYRSEKMADETSDSSLVPEDDHAGWNPLSSVIERILRGYDVEKKEAKDRQRTKQQKKKKKLSSDSTKDPKVITLFFDSVKKMTVAVLASPCPLRGDALLSTYFQSRVRKGTAYSVSPLYFELEGFVRENLFDIRSNLRDMRLDSVSVALGSLEESDEAQREELLSEERASNIRTFHSAEDSSAVFDVGRLEEILEIVRLNCLNEDLDVLSIYFLRLTSKAFGRIAARIARHRLQSATQLTLTPFVDGVSLTGYSKFVRRDGASLETIHTVRHSESGRAVEYERSQDIDLFAVPPVPQDVSGPGSSSVMGRYAPANLVDNCFSWKCEEVNLANLHRWWGDVSLPDYVGQKIVLTWKLQPGSADAIGLHAETGEDLLINLAALRLPVQTGPPRGVREWPLPQASITLNVVESAPTQLDDVAVSYTGRIRVEGARVDFPCLVRAAAKLVTPRLRDGYARIQDHRPLLPREEDYLAQVERAAAFV